MSKKQTVELGDMAKDIVCGFKGIAIARCEYLNNCVQFNLKPTTLDKGKPLDAEWFDEERLVVVKKGQIKISAPRTGGPDRGAPSSWAR